MNMPELHSSTLRLLILTITCSALLLSGCSTENKNPTKSIGNTDKASTEIPKGETQTTKKEKKQSQVVSGKITPKSAMQVGSHTEQESLPYVSKPIPHIGTHFRQTQVKRKALNSAYLQPTIYIPAVAENRENYIQFDENAVKQVADKPVSTFSIDVDTASYSNLRRLLMQGQLPPKDAVKTEELLNYFSYDYPVPENFATPFSISTEIAPSPWDKNKKLLHIGIKGYEIDKKDIPAANLVFLVDVSGSMRSPNKLGLVKQSLKLLLRQLDQDDKVSLVVYAGAAGIVLEPTPANEKTKVERAIDNLTTGGSTNGEAGIIEAYAMAQKGFIQEGINRVIIASDGDMNVGRFNINQLKELIEQKRKSGIALTTLGYGSGNYNYALMEQLADVGNGNAAYIDNLLEAQKVLVHEMSSTLLIIAKDVKIQIEFSPLVKEYRLIGYENRLLKREDFNNDKVDAGEIGAGHSITAIYEISLADAKGTVDPLRYQQQNNRIKEVTDYQNELAFLKIRYKHPEQKHSLLISQAIKTEQLLSHLEKSSSNFQFSASVAAFGQLLKGGKYLGDFSYTDIIQLAQQSKGMDKNGYRSEFIKLVELANNLSPETKSEKNGQVNR